MPTGTRSSDFANESHRPMTDLGSIPLQRHARAELQSDALLYSRPFAAAPAVAALRKPHLAIRR